MNKPDFVFSRAVMIGQMVAVSLELTSSLSDAHCIGIHVHVIEIQHEIGLKGHKTGCLGLLVSNEKIQTK